ncbi:MAG: TetR/AcrR family transcriptional regulator [Bacilli bacterium]|nr:TetR/AcrR family transcriptional regulator [Bacilli bacterium]
MNLLQRAQNNLVAEETSKLFFAQSINEVTIKDIANHIGIGEATIYRHYKNKFNIVLLVANYLQEKVASEHFDVSKGVTGYDKIAIFYNSYLDIFNSDPAYYRFINEFDAIVILNSGNDVKDYEKGIGAFKEMFDNCYKLGLKDGSVKPVEDLDSFYFATTHALLGLCKKLADKDVISQDSSHDKAKEIKVLIETILYRLK